MTEFSPTHAESSTNHRELPLAIRELTVANAGLLDFWDWCSSRSDRAYPDPVVGIAIAVNDSLLAGPCRDIRSRMIDETLHPAWDSWKRAVAGVMEKWGDRDNSGSLVRDPKTGAVQCTESAVEVEKEMEDLRAREDFKDLVELMDAKEARNRETGLGLSRVKVCCVEDFTHAPRDLPPRLLAVMMGGVVSELSQQLVR